MLPPKNPPARLHEQKAAARDNAPFPGEMQNMAVLPFRRTKRARHAGARDSASRKFLHETTPTLASRCVTASNAALAARTAPDEPEELVHYRRESAGFQRGRCA
ncbi:hypothetical protein [Burkholderia sp. WAC0059]|uniref:hypothetical protein n=1 Tax=Burkholderia sp. WAC0059 TaxID=2066022 RepID=UPI0011AF2766|nr:hypothetical protein [Burkholderia sp. WAC0059]